MNIYLFSLIFFLSAPAMLNAMLICETCSRQACASPIYHCPLGTHCARNAVITIGNENTKFLSIEIGKRFNIELPVESRTETWRLEPLPQNGILETLWQALAINDPALFIFTFKAKKGGTVDLELQRIRIATKTKQAPYAQHILEKKIITIEVVSTHSH